MMNSSDEPFSIHGETAYGCPGCGARPQSEAVGAGTEAHCNEDDCRVSIYEWR